MFHLYPEIGMFFKYMESLPPHMATMWKMPGLTGMRISTARTLIEDGTVGPEIVKMPYFPIKQL
jgi:hypothetical protein